MPVLLATLAGCGQMNTDPEPRDSGTEPRGDVNLGRDVPADRPADVLDAPSERRPLGAACAALSQCVSGVCVSGVCCDLSCTGACSSCTTAGQVGHCVALDEGTPCGPGVFCAGASISRSACDGAGVCATSVTSCGPYGCAGGYCKKLCTQSGECAPGHRCSLGACVPGGRFGGDACARPEDCLSGNCLPSRVCCDLPCREGCTSCTLAGSYGTCKTLPEGTDDSRCKVPICSGEPGCLEACVTDAHCGADLVCEGGACGKARGSKCTNPDACASRFCAGGFCCDDSCPGACSSCGQPGALGTCTPFPAGTASPSCGLYLCQGDAACPTSCTADSDCAASARCSNDGLCVSI